MRKLTITRTKSNVGRIGKVKFYIEDRVNGNEKINHTPCRFLGMAKNGETQTFEIDDQSLKVFAVDDKLIKNISNDYYQLPEGSEDVELTGERRTHSLLVTSFRFDNNYSEGITEHRKRINRNAVLMLIISFVVGIFVGKYVYQTAVGGVGREKNFESHGMSITLTNKFKEIEDERFPIAYTSDYMAVFAVQEPFEMFESIIDGFEDYTLYQYAHLVMSVNGLSGTTPKTVDGLVCFEYEKTVEDVEFQYYAYVFKTDDAFWLVQFSVKEKDQKKYESYVREWVTTVEFDD